LGERITRIVPIRTVHLIAAGLFVILGMMALFNLGGVF